MFRLTISEFKDWLACPQRANVKRFLGKWAPSNSSALSIGTAFHKGLESKLKSEPIPIPELVRQLDAKDIPKTTRLLEALESFAFPDWKVLGIEKPVRIQFPAVLGGDHQSPEWELVGRLDGLVEHEGKLWSLQAKTIDSSRPIAEEAQRVVSSFHEVAYDMMLRESGIHVAGTIVLLGVKLSKAAEDRGQPPIMLEVLPRNPERTLNLWQWSVLPTLRRCVLELIDLEANFMNTDDCLGKFGNSKCPLFDVCHHGANLERYAAINFTEPIVSRYPEFD